MTQEGAFSVDAHPTDGSRLDPRTERRLVWLMLARLVLSVVSFGIALVLDGLGRDLSPVARHGLYWTVAFAFFATVISGVAFSRVRRPARFAAMQIATDVAIVTSLVHFSGGRESVFTFLYVLVTVYGAVLFERRGALAAATLSAVCYGAVLFAANAGLLADLGAASSAIPTAGLALIWLVHVGALYLVGGLASVLSGELDRRTNDLERLQDVHQRTVESLMSGLLTTDSEGRITSFNPEAERITCAAAEALIGRDVEEVIPGARDLVIGTSQSRPAVRAQRARLPYRNRRGEDLFLGLAGSILRDVDGTPLGHVVIFQDVTEVVAMEGELRRSERLAAVGEMAAKIAHEIRNPLASISGSIQVLSAGMQVGPDSREPGRLMDIVVRETDRLNDLISDFLHYARPAPLAFLPVKLDELVGEVVQMLEASTPPEVVLETDVVDLTVSADAGQLRQVLWNLCLNGIQAMPEGGTLRIAAAGCGGRSDAQDPWPGGRNGASRGAFVTSGTAGWAEISVSDTGVGIPAEVQDRIFEPFFTTRREGSGLGLATVHRSVENHGGSLDLESEPGRGTTFRLRLPLAGGSE